MPDTVWANLSAHGFGPDLRRGDGGDDADDGADDADGSGRAREDLLGHPTVMWFYPAAATAG